MRELEQKIVGAMLAGDMGLNRKLAAMLDVGSFEDETCRTVFEEGVRSVEAGDDFDVLLCNTRTGLSLAGLMGLEMATPTRGMVEAWAAELLNITILRRLRAFGDYSKGLSSKAKPPQAKEAVKRVFERYMQVFANGHDQGQVLKPMGAVMRDTCEEVRSRYEAWADGGRGSPGLPTGLEALDNAMGGGIQPGELTLLGGRPSMGKSVLAGNILRRAAMEMKERCHVLFSLEMGHNQIGRRWIAAQGRVPAQVLRNGNFHGDEHVHRMLQGTKVLKEGLGDHCWCVDKPGATALDVKTYLYQVMETTGLPPGLVVVDHLHLMRGDKRLSKGDLVSELSQDLLDIARETGCAMLVLCQLNRGLESRENKRPLMSDLRDSGTLEQNANNVLFVYRDHKYNPEEADPNDMEVIVAKQRDGFIGSIHVHYDADMQLVDNQRQGYGGRYDH